MLNPAYIQAAAEFMKGAGSMFGGGGADRQLQRDMQREQLLMQGRQAAANFGLQGALFNTQARGQQGINQGLANLMNEMRGNVYAGIPNQQELNQYVAAQTQALQPRLEGLAGKLSSQFNLNSPAAQVALSKEAIAGEQRIRADAMAQTLQQRFAAQQNLRSILAELQSRMGSTAQIPQSAIAELQNLVRARYG